jgi:mRNA interferase MazF
MKRGEVYWADLEPTTGSEMQKTRPCVIVSNNVINNNASVIVICPITDAYGKTSPIHILIPETEGGLIKPSIAHCGQVRAIAKERLGGKLGDLSSSAMDSITKGIALALDIPVKIPI